MPVTKKDFVERWCRLEKRVEPTAARRERVSRNFRGMSERGRDKIRAATRLVQCPEHRLYPSQSQQCRSLRLDIARQMQVRWPLPTPVVLYPLLPSEVLRA